jgi:hypothetical protein
VAALTKERIMNKQSTPRKSAKINESTAATLDPTTPSRRKLATQASELSSSAPTTHSIPQKKPASNPIATAELAASITVIVSKQTRIIAMLQQSGGATLADLMTITGWQSHSVRGVMSGVLKKRMNLNVISERVDGQARRYRIKQNA